MNPSHFPQVLRSRSRSPSPAPRRRVSSDIGGSEVKHSSGVHISREERQFLSVVQDGCDHERRLRSFSDNSHRSPQRTPRRDVVAGAYTTLIAITSVVPQRPSRLRNLMMMMMTLLLIIAQRERERERENTHGGPVFPRM